MFRSHSIHGALVAIALASPGISLEYARQLLAERNTK